jgi:hypothetical protein
VNRSTRLRKPANLAKSLNRQLNSYALTASAAGVGILALTQPSEAKIVYSPAHRVIKGDHNYFLKLGGARDFEIVDFINCSAVRTADASASSPRPFQCNGYLNANGGAGNGVEGTRNASSFDAAVLHRGAVIGRQGVFNSRAVMCDVLDSSGAMLGHWGNVKNRYLGLEFVVDGKRHYGWARFGVKVRKYHITATLTGYAYETIPNKPIIAGKTKGPDVVTVQERSLGHLAAGRK